MRRRVVLTTVGSFGDLHPFIAVGMALKARGQEPVIAAAEEYRPKVENEGLAFHAVRPAYDQILKDSGLDFARLMREAASGAMPFLIKTMIAPYLEQTYGDLCDAMTGADLVVASTMSIVARLAVAKLKLPSVSLLLSPIAFSSGEAPPYLVELPGLPAIRRILGARVAQAILDLGISQLNRQTKSIAGFRRRLGLPSVRRDEVLGETLCADAIAALYSPLFGPLPPDAPKNSVIAGFSFYDSETGGPASLSPALAAFLAAGAPPLVFTLGSIVTHAAGAFYERAVEVSRRLGRPAVLLVGTEAEAGLSHLAAADIFVAGYAPHSLVFPRAGRVQLVCPFFGDQADNAERLVRLGVGKRLDLRRFTTARALKALGELLNTGPSAKAAALQAQVAREDGANVVADGIIAMLEARSGAAHED